MKNPTPLLFVIEPPLPETLRIEPTEELEGALAALLLQVLEAEVGEEVNQDEG